MTVNLISNVFEKDLKKKIIGENIEAMVFSKC